MQRTLLCTAIALTWHVLASAASAPHSALTLPQKGAGAVVRLRANGYWKIIMPASEFSLEGRLPSAVYSADSQDGEDGAGIYSEIVFRYQTYDGTEREGSIRSYHGTTAVLFTDTYPNGGPNALPFPAFSRLPSVPYRFTYEGVWGHYFAYLAPESPWMFFDDSRRTLMLSAASDFPIARTFDNGDGTYSCGIDKAVPYFRPGFSKQTLIVYGNGINSTMQKWGAVLSSWHRRGGMDVSEDVLMPKISYWTDALSAYYYMPQESVEYIPTLLAVKSYFSSLGFMLGSLQLDSWWYRKGDPSAWTDAEPWMLGGRGIWLLEADSFLFPRGLGYFQEQEIKLPLIAHTRWIDEKSPYRYEETDSARLRTWKRADGEIMPSVSGNVIIDPSMLDRIMEYLSVNGVRVYEQDWLSGPAVPEAEHASLFFDNLYAAARKHGLSMQYCMPRPYHFLQGSRYDLTIRVASDGFMRQRWDDALYNSALASALGLRPFVDNTRTASRSDLLLAALSAGPVGLGDEIGAVNAENLSKVAAPDGTIFRPDSPAAPIDEAYVAEARVREYPAEANRFVLPPMLACAYSRHSGGLATYYIFAYGRDADANTSPISFTPASLGMDSAAYVYDYFAQRGKLLQAADNSFEDAVPYDGTYYVVAPVGRSGIALLGDAGKYAMSARQRIAYLADDGKLALTLAFMPGEKYVPLIGYAGHLPSLAVSSGKAALEGYDPQSGIFRLTASPDGARQAALTLQ